MATVNQLVRKPRKRRRKQIIVPVGNQSGGSIAPSMSGGTKTNTVFIGQSSEKTLLDLQSLNNKHN